MTTQTHGFPKLYFSSALLRTWDLQLVAKTFFPKGVAFDNASLQTQLKMFDKKMCYLYCKAYIYKELRLIF